MRTIGYKWPNDRPDGDYAVHCDYCGVKWRRSQCVRKPSGRLACPDDAEGRDEVELDEANARSNTRRTARSRHDEGGFYAPLETYTGDDDPTFLTQRRTRDDI